MPEAGLMWTLFSWIIWRCLVQLDVLITHPLSVMLSVRLLDQQSRHPRARVDDGNNRLKLHMFISYKHEALRTGTGKVTSRHVLEECSMCAEQKPSCWPTPVNLRTPVNIPMLVSAGINRTSRWPAWSRMSATGGSYWVEGLPEGMFVPCSCPG